MILVGHGREWPPSLRVSLAACGYQADEVPDLAAVPAMLGGGVRAVCVLARPLGASDLLVLRQVREASPRTAIVMVTRTSTDPDLKRAFEDGATAFLSWPSPESGLRQAIESGGA